MTKKIVVAGASTYGVKNAGDDAMFANLVEGLRRRLPDCRITFLARHPDPEFDRVFGVSSIKNIDHDRKEESLGRWFLGFNPGDPTGHLREIRHAIEECDLLVIGGNSFMEVSESELMRGVCSYSLQLATWARLFEKPYVLYGVAAHPIENDYTKKAARYLCSNAAVVTVREGFTKEELLKAGVDGGNIRVFADPAFGLDPVGERTRGLEILKRDGIRTGSGKLIGVAFRHMYWKWSEDEFDGYAAKLASMCDHIIEKTGAEILFIPNCTYNVDTKYEDDRVIAEHVIGKMKRPERVYSIKGELMLPDTLALYRLLDMLISNRRHSCIFAAIHGVAMLPMSTGHRWHFVPFAKELSVQDSVVSFTDDDLEGLKRKAMDTWDKREILVGKMNARLPGLREMARDQVDMLVDAVDAAGQAGRGMGV